MKTKLQENLAQRLCDSIERLHQQADKVQFWASAVTGLAQPVPDYEPETTAVARYLKPGRPAAEAPSPARRQPERQGEPSRGR